MIAEFLSWFATQPIWGVVVASVVIGAVLALLLLTLIFKRDKKLESYGCRLGKLSSTITEMAATPNSLYSFPRGFLETTINRFYTSHKPAYAFMPHMENIAAEVSQNPRSEKTPDERAIEGILFLLLMVNIHRDDVKGFEDKCDELSITELQEVTLIFSYDAIGDSGISAISNFLERIGEVWRWGKKWNKSLAYAENVEEYKRVLSHVRNQTDELIALRRSDDNVSRMPFEWQISMIGENVDTALPDREMEAV